MLTATLDHIVHLTPPGSLQETAEQFRKLGFNVVEGGVHADGLTENSLVILRDEVYLELISFTKPPEAYPPSSRPRREHGEALKWVITAPTKRNSILPFFCGDLTDRSRRSSYMDHPCGARGIAHIRLVTAEAENQRRHGEPPISSTSTETKWQPSTLNGPRPPTLILSTPSDQEQYDFVFGSAKTTGKGLFRLRSGKLFG
ncbi:Zn(2)-C6 fungal-type domain-containing protein [Favolaschia claudopus]|uniref:Zn(2)-C6 fungal-type domain-containing protein n=1 Tax=Favolaschia claudopus TaxID=2862362 RepID=A0AAW0C970_9AGAR